MELFIPCLLSETYLEVLVTPQGGVGKGFGFA